MIIISVKDTVGSYLDVSIQNELYSLGLAECIISQYMIGYIALIKTNVVIQEKRSAKGDFLDEIYHVNFLTLNVVSRPYNNGNTAKILINGIDYAADKRGLNIVIYSFDTNKVVDSVAFDTHDKKLTCTRRFMLDKEDMIRVDLKKLHHKLEGKKYG